MLKTFEVSKRDVKLLTTRVMEFQQDQGVSINMKANVDSSFLAMQASSDPNTMMAYCLDTAEMFLHECGSKAYFKLI